MTPQPGTRALDPVRTLAVNALFTTGFLTGAYAVWSALATLVLGRERGWPAVWSLTTGLAIWVVLAQIATRRAARQGARS
ncbi:MAG: hypothetical protein IPJ14_23160 [Kineosporiaceae bacterium]|nr:hypothetical protein [Kineosporiaceae bacterium]MBK7625474.1 hypothetical protein [Kineosporiaceae bacterium]MBK8076163.1 hypothetical protein [Kineosporiaceae bacterium]